MPRQIDGYEINPVMDDGSTIIRKARKGYRCSGGYFLKGKAA